LPYRRYGAEGSADGGDEGSAGAGVYEGSRGAGVTACDAEDRGGAVDWEGAVAGVADAGDGDGGAARVVGILSRVYGEG